MDVPHSSPIRLLLVEDSAADARLAREHLHDAPPFQVRIRWTKSLAEALDALQDETFDVALLDLSLPDSSGIETFTKFYAAASHLPVIVLSGNEDEEMAREIVKRGGQDALPKDLITGPLIRRSISHAIERIHIHEELRSMRMQLIQAEKMESIGRLAAGVAHEVKNPLARIMMGIDYLSSGIDPDDKNLPIILQRMDEAVHRADEIIRGLLNFASNRSLELKPIEVNSLVDNALMLVGHEIKSHGVIVEPAFGQNLPLIHVDAPRMEQVLINLLMNAIQAMENVDRPTLAIRTAVQKVDPFALRNEGARTAHLSDDPASRVIIEIEDNGPGIPLENLNKLFDPFFTTKPAGVGTGLGLSVVKKIIDLHRGQLMFENKEPHGARVRLAFSCDSHVSGSAPQASDR